ncbi:MAG: hypothetical protein U9Q78_06510 [Chloroflexota bacterium]|nr:hypothetical protein [Chloroflexota bacterium]
MFEPLRLTVLAPTGTLLDVDQADWVQVQLTDGAPLGIFPGHAPLLAETAAAPLRYADRSGEHVLDLKGGILHIKDGSVIVLINESARPADAAPPGFPALEPAGGARFERLARELLTEIRADEEG